MSSDKHCCVPGCRESGGMHQVLHGFPNPEKDRNRFKAWLYTIGGDILALDNRRIYKYRRVCHSHFEEKYLCRYNRISNIAVPTLNLPDPLSLKQCITLTPPVHRKPMQEILNPNEPSTSGQRPLKCDIPTSMDIGIDGSQKENIASATLVQLSSLDSTPSNAAGAVNKSQNLVERRQIIKKNTKKVFLSKTEREMHKNIVSLRIKISKIKKKLKQKAAHIKAAKKLTSSPAALSVLDNCSSTAKLLIHLQSRENKKKEKGRRFTLQEKIAALSIYKQSPKGYRFLRNIFILPAQQTLVKLIQRSNLRPGLNKNIFGQLKSKAELMTTKEKLAILLFDEVSLKPSVTFQERKDIISGFVDNGLEKMQELADHAQVFMVRGLIKNYKQPLYYTFSKNATKGPELAKQIKEVISAVQEAGLCVVATICDQGTNNRQAINILLNETRGHFLRKLQEPKENIIMINDQEIIPLYDPPHLIKGMRNNLINKDLHYIDSNGASKIAKWSHLQLLLKENPGYQGIRLIPKLTECHVNPEKINKMKVKYATQIFSRTVASNMGYLADKGILPAVCKETADLLLFMDNVFDSVNGSHTKNKFAKPLLGPATPTSPHHKVWEESKKIFKSMAFVTNAGKKESIPTVINWMWTLNGIQILLKKLKSDYNITSVWLRHLNQDPLENFFGAVRSHGCRNVNPTCDQFESAFATLLINNLNSVNIRGKNCEGDFCNALHSLIINKNVEPTLNCQYDFGNILNFEFTTLESKERDPRIIAPLQYISGYVLKKAKTCVIKSCTVCIENLSSANEIEYIRYREYAGRRWLCTPSNELIKLVSNMQDVINKIIKESYEKPNIKEIIKTALLILIDFSLIKCDLHKNKLIDYLMSIVIRFFIYNYCKLINQILAGRRQVDDEEDSLQIKALKFKCYKRHHS